MLRRALDGLYLFSGYAAGGFMVLIFVLMMGLSAGRPIGFNIPAGDDIVAWCMAAMSFLGLAHTFRSGEMIRVGLLIDRISGRPRFVIEIAALVVGCGFIGFFAYYAVAMTYDPKSVSWILEGWSRHRRIVILRRQAWAPVAQLSLLHDGQSAAGAGGGGCAGQSSTT